MAAPSAPSNNFLVGKMVAVAAAGKFLYCTDGSTQRKVTLVKVTNAQSLGYQEMAVGGKAASANLNLVYNGADPISLNEGDPVTLIVDTMGKAKELGIQPATGGTLKGRLLEIPGFVESVGDKWNCEQDYTWSVAITSSGAYVVSDNSGDQVAGTTTPTVTDPPTGS